MAILSKIPFDNTTLLGWMIKQNLMPTVYLNLKVAPELLAIHEG